MILDGACILFLLSKYLQNESFPDIFFQALYTQSFSTFEKISSDENSRLLYAISDMFYIATCLANLSDSSFQ